jgi:TAT (twin-arginine translocation) pathway signal sequence.
MGEQRDGFSRRDFLRFGLLAGSAAAAGCAWDGGRSCARSSPP